LNNHSFNRLSAELREGDPLCRYVTVERSSIELTIAQHAENTAQLAIACDLLQCSRADLLRAWKSDGNHLQPSQEAAVHSIDECLSVSLAAIRRYRHSVRYEYAASLRGLLTSTANALTEDARHEREQGHKRIAETIENMGEATACRWWRTASTPYCHSSSPASAWPQKQRVAVVQADHDARAATLTRRPHSSVY
jgi:hypothetical protein